MISRSSVGRFSATFACNCWNLAVSSFSSFCEAGCGFVAMFNYSVEAFRQREGCAAEREFPSEILSEGSGLEPSSSMVKCGNDYLSSQLQSRHSWSLRAIYPCPGCTANGLHVSHYASSSCGRAQEKSVDSAASA